MRQGSRTAFIATCPWLQGTPQSPPAPQLVLLVDVLRGLSFGAGDVERERRDEVEDFIAAFAFLTGD
jgi:hypothetical protein